ncbi:MAG: PQQ-binding-like beta-propeller repeat protein [Planctomycetaceae bacterium]|nr:PQQ-binding-like beta-propeller repeat protein [Planctomycetaceae bacterium]
MKRLSALMAILGALAVAAVPADAGDWPMWRYNPGHGAWTSEALPRSFSGQWSIHLPTPKSAWPFNQHKQQFDASYEPIVAGKLLIVPSMVRDSVTAYDTDTGAQKWRFYADAPVRFAPVASKDKCWFSSDDGNLYCLSLADGKLLYKVQGPAMDYRILANDRLSSAWPARGGPVLADGVVYFAAGIWPFMGTFIYAVDADSGKVLWCNSGSGAVYILQPHASPAFAGVGPQGYMTVSGDTLVVPGGRSVPAGYDRKTGRFLWCNAVTHAGGYDVISAAGLFWCERQVAAAADGEPKTNSPAAVLTDEAAIGLEGEQIVARELKMFGPPIPDRRGKTSKPGPPNILWQVPSGGMKKLHIGAGKSLYGSDGASSVICVDTAAKSVAWQAKVEGKIWTMLAGDGKLFVVTREGRIYCFNSGSRTPEAAAPQVQPVATQDDLWKQIAAGAMKISGAAEGYAVALGLGSGRLVDELILQSKLHVIVFESDAAKIAAARRRYDAAGVYGERVHVMTSRPGMRVAPYLASLIVSEDPAGAGLGSDTQIADAILNMLRPYGGTLYLTGKRACNPDLTAKIEALRSDHVLVRRGDDDIRMQRVGALPGSADWTHQYASAANTVSSTDSVAKAPLGLMWFGGPSNMDVLPRHGHGPSPQVAAGRLVIEGIGVIHARDVYTGRVIWRREFPKLNTFGMYYTESYNPDPFYGGRNQGHYPGANLFGSNYVTMADRVYLVDQTVCHVLNAASGETLADFKLPAAEGAAAPNWGVVLADQDVLVATAQPLQVPEAGQASPDGLVPVIPKGSSWQYLAGSDPQGQWGDIDYAAAGWKSGKLPIGYKYADAATTLSDMRGKYTRVYLRHTFEVADTTLRWLTLGVKFDDAFIAYLNGKEVARGNVAKGSGGKARGIKEHPATDFEYVDIKCQGLLRPGKNVLAIEGHNTSVSSSDFMIDACLLALPPSAKQIGRPVYSRVPGVTANGRFGESSELLVVMDRVSGKVLWQRKGEYGFRHNAVVAAAGKVFAIDGLSKQRAEYLDRRGVEFTAKPTLYAFDAHSGKVLWQTSQNVFGTWLGYSAEHDILLQGGSEGPDRGGDEVGKGMTAHRGKDGSVIWTHDEPYSGPPVIRRDMILTQTGGANTYAPPAKVYNLLTGGSMMRRHIVTGQQIPYEWVRFKGCNTAVASEHLLTFRSASAAFVPMDLCQGTASLGGFKSGCTSNLIVADGVLNAPDYTRTCTCSYQNQSSLAMVNMPEIEYWGIDAYPPVHRPTAVRRVGVNFGAPGNRTADSGTLWVEHPSIAGPSPDVPVRTSGAGELFRNHNTTVAGALNWVTASGVTGLSEIRIRPFLQPQSGKVEEVVRGWNIRVGQSPSWGENPGGQFSPPRAFTVRLCFAEPDDVAAGARVFDVSLQGKVVLANFDIAAAAGGPRRSVIKEFKNVMIADDLKVGLTARTGKTLICGVELVDEAEK